MAAIDSAAARAWDSVGWLLATHAVNKKEKAAENQIAKADIVSESVPKGSYVPLGVRGLN